MSAKNEHVKVDIVTPRKLVLDAFDFADRAFAHLDSLQLEPADMIDIGSSFQSPNYGQTPFDGVRITFRWLDRPWLRDADQPHNVVSSTSYLHGLPVGNQDVTGIDEFGLLMNPVPDVATLECEGAHPWYVSLVCYDGWLCLVLPRCVVQSAKYLRQIKAMLRQPAWFGKRDNTDGYCVYTGSWFGALDSPTTAPELFEPADHYWFTNDRPYATNPGRSVIPQAAMGYGSLCCCKGNPNPEAGLFSHDDGVWKIREHARLAKRVYNELPDRVIEALDMDRLKYCYPHLAVQEDHTGMVAFTRDDAAGARDRQLVMKPGRFIRQFARNSSISDDEVKYLAAEACGTVEIKFCRTSDRKEFSRIYQRGPQSCMAYGPLANDQFDGGHLMVNGEFVHPTEIYAHPDNDIELMYGVLGEDNIVSRALVNTKALTYCTIYVKDSPSTARDQMESHLRKKGFKYSDQVLYGQKLLLIDTDDRSIICPYLDPGNIGVRISRDGACLIAGGDEQANHATGTLMNYTCGHENDWSCDCCGADFEEDDDEGYEHDQHGNRVCQSCIDSSYTLAFATSEGEETYVRDSETIHSCQHLTSGDLVDYSYVFFNSSRRDIRHYGCVELDTSRYDDNGRTMIANIDDAVADDNGDWVLRDDLDTYNLFVDPDGDAHDISEWVAVTEEDGAVTLMERSDLDEELYDEAPANHEDWPMLDFFILKVEAEEDEDDGSVNVLTDDEDECPDQSVA